MLTLTNRFLPHATRLLLALLLMSSISMAQTKTKKLTATSPDYLTNASIVDLSKAGLDKDLIISKIESSQAKFDLSTNGLIALKSQKVDNDVIKAMLIKSGSTGEHTASKETTKTSHFSVPALDMINHVYWLDQSGANATPLEKATANVKTKYKLMGAGGVSRIYQINESKSPVRISGRDSILFVINTGGGTIPELSLYKLQVDKKSRGAVTDHMTLLSGPGGGEPSLTYSTSQLKPGVYLLKPTQKLEPGEYYFSGKPGLNISSIDAFAFGVD